MSILLSSYLLIFFHHLLSSIVNILKNTVVDKLPNDLEGMEASMEHLQALIEDVYKYVEGVVVSSFAILFCNSLACVS